MENRIKIIPLKLKNKNRIRKIIRKTACCISIGDPSLSIVFVSREKIKKINEEFRKKKYSTDVISFPSGLEDYLGDVILCREEIIENAQRLGVNPEEEMTRVIVHGFLHLIGYEDDNREKKKKMWIKQEEIMKELKKEKLTCIL